MGCRRTITRACLFEIKRKKSDKAQDTNQDPSKYGRFIYNTRTILALDLTGRTEEKQVESVEIQD